MGRKRYTVEQIIRKLRETEIEPDRNEPRIIDHGVQRWELDIQGTGSSTAYCEPT